MHLPVPRQLNIDILLPPFPGRTNVRGVLNSIVCTSGLHTELNDVILLNPLFQPVIERFA